MFQSNTLSQVSIELDELNNLNLEYTTAGGQEYQDSVSLNSISGVLVVQNTLPGATMTIVKVASSQQVYNGPVTAGNIPTGAGTIKVTITQFGKTVEKTLQVAGESMLDISGDIVTVTPPNSALSWTMNSKIGIVRMKCTHRVHSLSMPIL